jgi:hypothetical protein
MFDALRHALEQQHELIAEQLAAVVEAEAALARVRRAFGIEDASQSVQDARGRAVAVSADASERAYGPSRRPCAAPDCDVQFEAKGKRRYCSSRCRTRTASRAYAARKAKAEDAAWRQQTEQLRQLHETEGYGSNNGAIWEYQ